MHRKIIAGIMILTALTAVGCSDSVTKNETAENEITHTSINYSDVEHISTTSENESNASDSTESKTKITNTDIPKSTEIKTENSEVTTVQSSQIPNENKISDEISSENSNTEIYQKNPVSEVIPDEEDIIFESPATTLPKNESSFTVTTTESIEDEEVIVTESVIELPFVPAR